MAYTPEDTYSEDERIDAIEVLETSMISYICKVDLRRISGVMVGANAVTLGVVRSIGRVIHADLTGEG